METKEQRQWADFFADLANTPSSDLNNTPSREPLLGKLSNLMDLPYRWQILSRPDEEDGEDYTEWLEKTKRQRAERALEPFHKHVTKVIGGLLAGSEMPLGVFEVVGQLTIDRRLKEEFRPPQEDRPHSLNYGDYVLPLYYKFHQVLRRQPFPFGRCEREGCRKIFVQPARGKPRLYCSTACRLQSSPAVAQHTAYIREERQKKRKREIAKTQALLRDYPEEKRHWPKLEQEFPRKSRRQLLYLVKQARGVLKIKRKETA